MYYAAVLALPTKQEAHNWMMQVQVLSVAQILDEARVARTSILRYDGVWMCSDDCCEVRDAD